MTSTFAPLASLVLSGLLMSVLPAAQAVTLAGTVDNGNVVNTDFFSPSLVAADIGFLHDQPVTLNMLVDGEEASGQVGFNAVIDQFQPGQSLSNLLITLTGGATFAQLGGLTTLPGQGPATVTLSNGNQTALISFNGLAQQLFVGNPFGEALQDWQISVQGLSAGSAFSMTVSAVPEPTSLALVLASLGCSGLLARRRLPR